MECKNVSAEFKRFENANSYSMMFFLRYQKVHDFHYSPLKPLSRIPSQGHALGNCGGMTPGTRKAPHGLSS